MTVAMRVAHGVIERHPCRPVSGLTRNGTDACETGRLS